ncbi:MAG: hypothetical protein ABSA21_06855 [Candidatus Limnocylindrales bacterium]|jgi:hypothetical protein
MGTLERRETLSHRLGAGGRLSVKTVTGGLRIRGIEGEDVHVTVNYRIRATDQASAERALDTGRVAVERGPGYLEVETPERRLSTGLAWLFGGARVSADISIDVPWGARLHLETMSASIEAANLVGDQKYRTVSGDIRLWNLGGLVEAGTISGGITLDGGTALRLRASTISGGIKARAGLFHSLSLSTTSGSMTVIGALDPAGEHRAESISGGVDLTPLSGVSAELKTVSGSIRSDIERRVEGTRGFWRAIVGDGRAHLRVNSTSGSLRLLAPRAGDGPSGPSASPTATSGSAPGASSAAGTGTTGEPAAPTPGPQSAPDEEPAETWNPNETAEEAAQQARDERADDEELAVLQALERGEIGVDEAAARLERTGGSDDVR